MSYEQIQVNTQSSIRIGGAKVLYFDPFQIKESRHDADVIFITHAHYDHYEPDSIKNVAKEGTVFVAPAGMAKEMAAVASKENLRLLSPGEELQLLGLSVTAVPAYNKLKPFHPRHNKWLGYLAEMDGIRYYVSGDTDAVKELQSVKCDVALVPIGGTYTMTAKEAAGLINAIKPKAVIPTHYGSIVGDKKDIDELRKLVDEEIRVVEKLVF